VRSRVGPLVEPPRTALDRQRTRATCEVGFCVDRPRRARSSPCSPCACHSRLASHCLPNHGSTTSFSHRLYDLTKNNSISLLLLFLFLSAFSVSWSMPSVRVGAFAVTPLPVLLLILLLLLLWLLLWWLWWCYGGVVVRDAPRAQMCRVMSHSSITRHMWLVESDVTQDCGTE